MSRTLALVSCTKSKLPTASPAAELYSASQAFRLAYEFARRHADDIVILSAKYGAVRSDEVLAPYEETLKGAPRARKREWARATHAKLRTMSEYQKASNVLWLAGRDYYDELLPLIERDGKRSELPLARMPQGKQRQWLQRKLAESSSV